MLKEDKMPENGEKKYFDQLSGEQAPKSWSKYTTKIHNISHE